MERGRAVSSDNHMGLDAFNRLVGETQDRAYTLAYAILGEGHAAEKVVRKAYVQAYQSAGRWNGSNQTLQIYRAVLAVIQQEASNNPTRVNFRAEFPKGSAWHSLLALPVELRLAVVLVDVTGLDYTQAAEVTGLPAGEIGKRLSKARAWIASSM
ncbi:MAG TPA: sigma factor-like helix-turn-helix DNA-binding protein [Anaerolineales bacterium]